MNFLVNWGTGINTGTGTSECKYPVCLPYNAPAMKLDTCATVDASAKFDGKSEEMESGLDNFSLRRH